jgi:hypothetical protein
MSKPMGAGDAAESSVSRGQSITNRGSRIIEVAPDRLAERGHSVKEIFELVGANGFHAYELENDYDMISYVPPVPRKPILRVVDADVTEQTDIVFSRVDQPRL